MRSSFTIRALVARLLAPAAILSGMGFATAALVDTTINDFFQPGTQPNTLATNVFESISCTFCHSDFDPNHAPYDKWVTSMMAQSARDPIFYACLAIANQDAAFSGDLCIRCHSPVAWLEGRSTPTDASAFETKDFDGVTCHVCHRMVDPVFEAGNPPEDEGILAALGQVPTNPHSGQYVIDPQDRRRGPYQLQSFFYHQWRQSPYHRDAMMCATCHDVSNPAYTRAMDGSYVLNDPNQPHPTHDKHDEFPMERTFSEWMMSDFALGPIDMGGRFGGELAEVSSCQDCHMPTNSGRGCNEFFGGQFRSDLKLHEFNGANTWVLDSVHSLYPEIETALTPENVAEAKERTLAMLQAASDMELTQVGYQLQVRIINQTGHKLPTGYPEGRRMWINVRFLDENDQLVAEHGAYDPNTATLDDASTKVYEGSPGLDAAVATATGLAEGPSFHFAINNKWFKDNRIPPRGFANATFEAVQAEPVGYSYADGQYWDDTLFTIPRDARHVEVSVYYQITSREYIEFLRDENTTNDAGQVAYDQWVMHGKSAPAELDNGAMTLAIPGDLDMDGDVDITDLSLLLASYAMDSGGDIDLDGDTDLTDLSLLLSYFGSH